MTKKKADRFERIVHAELKKMDVPGYPCIWLNGPDVVMLLRKEHQAGVDLVRQQVRVCKSVCMPSGDALEGLLKLMKQRAT